MSLVTIKEVLISPEKNPDGWLYLPSDSKKWNLTTFGEFLVEDIDSDPEEIERKRIAIKDKGLIETIDNVTIEDIVLNANTQLDSSTPTQLFAAFSFYYNNDSFIVF